MNRTEQLLFDTLRGNLDTVEHMCARYEIDMDEAEEVLVGWEKDGLYESGLTMTTGWLTESGMEMDGMVG